MKQFQGNFSNDNSRRLAFEEFNFYNPLPLPAVEKIKINRKQAGIILYEK